MKVPKLRFPEFSNSWQKEKISDLIIYEQPSRYLVENDEYVTQKDNNVPVLTANKSFILGYTDEKNNIYNDECILFDDFTLDIKYVDFPFKVKSSALKILTGKNNVDLIFFYNLLLYKNYKPQAHKRHWISDVSRRTVYISEIEEQKKIGEFFALLDKEIDFYRQKSEKLNIYKKIFINKILDFSSKNHVYLNEFSYETNTMKKKKLKYLEIGGIDVFDKTYSFSNKKTPKEAQFASSGSILVSTVRPTRGAITILKEDCYVSSAFAIIQFKNEALNLWTYYILQSEDFLRYIKTRVEGSSYPTIKKDEIFKYKIPLISEDQMKKYINLIRKVEDQINLIRKRVSLLEKRKKAFLQQMFV